jgi:hypothetical protein
LQVLWNEIRFYFMITTNASLWWEEKKLLLPRMCKSLARKTTQGGEIRSRGASTAPREKRRKPERTQRVTKKNEKYQILLFSFARFRRKPPYCWRGAARVCG